MGFLIFNIVGQKTCTHVHGVFPYLYILDDPRIANLENRLAIALDRTINSAFKVTQGDTQQVFKIIKVRGR